MSKFLVESLEEIARFTKKSTDTVKIKEAIDKTLTIVRDLQNGRPSPILILDQLDEELSVWRLKLDVILKEPAGRQGLVRHAGHWVEKIKGIS
jgi:hypothetical protein